MRKEVCDLVDKEYEVANKNYGPLNSTHEGYAVLMEEVEEVEEELKNIKERMKSIWYNIRLDNTSRAKTMASLAMAHAINTACESIQVAAVCQRILNLREDGKHAKT